MHLVSDEPRFFPMRPLAPVPDASGYDPKRGPLGWAFLAGVTFAAGFGIGAALALGWMWTH